MIKKDIVLQLHLLRCSCIAWVNWILPFGRTNSREEPKNLTTVIPFIEEYSQNQKENLINRWKYIDDENILFILNYLSKGMNIHDIDRKTNNDFIMNGIDLSAGDLRGFHFERNQYSNKLSLDLENCKLEYTFFDGCYFSDTNLSKSNLRWSKFLECNLPNSNFTGTKLYQAKFLKSCLLSSKFIDSKMRNISFNECTLQHCDFTNAKLIAATINNCDMSYSTLKDTDFENANLFDIKIDKKSLLQGRNNCYKNCYIDRISDNITGSYDIEDIFRNIIYNYHIDNKLLEYDPMRCFKTNEPSCPKKPIKNNKLIFVGCPFKSEYLDIYEHGIIKSIEENNFQVWRADYVISTQDVMCKVCFKIQESSLAIIDISEANPNVMFELGLCYGRNLEVILIYKKSDSPIITDLKGLEYIPYSYSGDLKNQLNNFLNQWRAKSPST